MRSPRYLIGALSGWAYGERRRQCLDTWFADAAACGLGAVFLLGEPSVKAPNRHGPLLILPCHDAYQTLPQRTWWFVRWALEQGDWDYLFKCDDYTYVAASRLAGYEPAGHDYIGAEWRPGAGYGTGGAGYLLSRKAAECVVRKPFPQIGDEDVLVGARMRENGIPLMIDARFVPWGTEGRRPRPDNDTITAHKFTDAFKRRYSAEESQRLAAELWRQTHEEMQLSFSSFGLPAGLPELS